MLKTLIAQVRQYKWVSIITPVFSALEAVADMILPFFMAKIIDYGVKGDGGMPAILKYGGLMLAVALGALLCGILAARFASIASTGFATNLRDAMFTNIQTRICTTTCRPLLFPTSTVSRRPGLSRA